MPLRLFVATLALFIAGCADIIKSGADGRASIDHRAISVANADVSARFYEGIFGFREMKSPFAGGGGVLWLDIGNGMALHLFGGRRNPIANERERHFAVTVNDISRVTAYLKAHGMAWQDFGGTAGRIQTRPDGVHQFFFQDPDGYWIEVNDAVKTANR